jgi:hypothetical protein
MTARVLHPIAIKLTRVPDIAIARIHRWRLRLLRDAVRAAHSDRASLAPGGEQDKTFPARKSWRAKTTCIANLLVPVTAIATDNALHLREVAINFPDMIGKPKKVR